MIVVKAFITRDFSWNSCTTCCTLHWIKWFSAIQPVATGVFGGLLKLKLKYQTLNQWCFLNF